MELLIGETRTSIPLHTHAKTWIVYSISEKTEKKRMRRI